MTTFKKADAGKPMFGLVPALAHAALARVLTFGANEYGANNWARTPTWSRYIDALERHWNAWKAGENLDPKTGENHLAHLLCNAYFLLELQLRGLSKDDRWRPDIPGSPVVAQAENVPGPGEFVHRSEIEAAERERDEALTKLAQERSMVEALEKSLSNHSEELCRVRVERTKAQGALAASQTILEGIKQDIDKRTNHHGGGPHDPFDGDLIYDSAAQCWRSWDVKTRCWVPHTPSSTSGQGVSGIGDPNNPGVRGCGSSEVPR